MIDTTKRHQTKSGLEVRDLRFLEGDIYYSILGSVVDKDGHIARCSWSKHGTAYRGEESVLDLVEVKDGHAEKAAEQKAVKVFANIYSKGTFAIWATKSIADRNADVGRIACVPVEVPYTEGEGL